MSVTQSAATAPGLGARVYSVLSALLVLLVVVQVFVAGSGLFTMAHQLDNGQAYSVKAWNDSGYWGIHFFNSFAIAVVMVAMLVTSFVGGLPARVKRMSGILILLLVLQGVLGFIPWPAPVAALHVFNAFGILAMAGLLMRGSWAFGRNS